MIAIVVSCVMISWTSVYFLGDDNIVEEEMESIEINTLEQQFHFTQEQAEKDVEFISPKHKIDKNHG